jgi:hypothetical protein
LEWILGKQHEIWEGLGAWVEELVVWHGKKHREGGNAMTREEGRNRG